jgi:hypothetical protein
MVEDDEVDELELDACDDEEGVGVLLPPHAVTSRLRTSALTRIVKGVIRRSG